MASPVRAGRRLIANLGLVCAAGTALTLTAGPAWAGGTGHERPGHVAAGQEQSRVVGTPTLTVQQRSTLASKDRAINATVAKAALLKTPQPKTALSRTTTRSATVQAAAAYPTHRSVQAIRQQAQQRSYWCGPATLASLVQASGISLSQSTAAVSLSTTANGTDWYRGGGDYPMERALDRYVKGFNYTPVNLPYTPSTTDTARFKQRLMSDVATYQKGIAGNAVEVTNGPHLNGHPNRTIYHWVPVRGYDDSGATTRYADSVAGSAISWAGPVPRYNEINTAKIVLIFGARGYIW